MECRTVGLGLAGPTVVDMTGGLMPRRVPDVVALVDTSPTRSLTATATATAVLSGADLLGRSSTGLAGCPALYDDELCFGLVAAWTDVDRLLIRPTCQSDYSCLDTTGVTSSVAQSDVTSLHKLAYVKRADSCICSRLIKKAALVIRQQDVTVMCKTVNVYIAPDSAADE